MAKGFKTGGRKAGTPNKATRELKDMILGALDAEGGMEYLRAQARENPVAFMSLVGRVLPLQHTGANGGPMTFTVATGVPRADD